MPQRLAIPRVLHCVASFGLLSNVSVITRSTSLSLIFRGAPGRGSSSRPSVRFWMKRFRHLPTIAFDAHLGCHVTVAFSRCTQQNDPRTLR
jgi:hypothetical protein